RVGAYLSAYYDCAWDFVDSSLFIPMIATGVLIIRIDPGGKPIFQIFIISLLFFALHLLVFPAYTAYDQRFFTWFIALTFMTLIRATWISVWPVLADQSQRSSADV